MARINKNSLVNLLKDYRRKPNDALASQLFPYLGTIQNDSSLSRIGASVIGDLTNRKNARNQAPQPTATPTAPRPPVQQVQSVFNPQQAQQQQQSLMAAFNKEIQAQQQRQLQYQQQLAQMSQQYNQQSNLYSQNERRFSVERNEMLKKYNQEIGSLTQNLMGMRDKIQSNEGRFAELQQPNPDQENFNTALNQYRLLQFLRGR